jgi:hypothetical protein
MDLSLEKLPTDAFRQMVFIQRIVNPLVAHRSSAYVV